MEKNGDFLEFVCSGCSRVCVSDSCDYVGFRWPSSVPGTFEPLDGLPFLNSGDASREPLYNSVSCEQILCRIPDRTMSVEKTCPGRGDKKEGGAEFAVLCFALVLC